MTTTTGIRRHRGGAGERLGRPAMYALGLLVAAQAADYLTFLVMVDLHGLGAERNPIVAALADHGVWMLTFAKGALVVYVATTFIVTRMARPRVARTMLAFGIAMGLVGAISNLAAL